MKVQIGTTKWWSLQTGGHSSEVVVSSGLTVLVNGMLKFQNSETILLRVYIYIPQYRGRLQTFIQGGGAKTYNLPENTKIP